MITEEVKRQHEAFWHQEAFGRCCLYLTAPKAETPPREKPRDLKQMWEDIPWRVRREQQSLEDTLLLGDAIPSVFTNFGPGCLTACIGGTHKWSEFTVWFENEPFFIQDWENPPEPVLNQQSAMYRLVEEYSNVLLQAGKGKFYTSITDIGGTYDVVAALRGTQNLLIDLYEYPEEIKAFVEKLLPLWKTFFLHQSQRLFQEQGAMTSWMPIYSEKPYYPLQCDFSAMISPDMFEEFVLPELRYHLSYLERSIYHWDGPGELVHLDHLLSLETLDAIQWVPGDGAPNTTDPCWYEYFEKIQRAGKSLILLESDPNGVENLLKHISTKGLFLRCDTKDEKQAKEILQIADSIGVK